MKITYEKKFVQGSNYVLCLYVDYFNQRLRVDDYRGNMKEIVSALFELMDKHNFTKLIFYARQEHWRELLFFSFQLEGVIHRYFNGSDNYIMTYYFDEQRKVSGKWREEDNIIQAIHQKNKARHVAIPSKYQFRQTIEEDAFELAGLYANVFSVYPTPMSDPAYIQNMMKSGAVFYVVEYNGQLVSAASAEINFTNHNAEITDCATLKEHRTYGLMKQLLQLLEQHLKNEGIYCVFSLARARSYGMNAVLAQLGYQYNGRLTNNCYIFSNELEDMNIWTKDLAY